MFTLNKYVDSLLELAGKEKDKKKRREIMESWVKMLKRHHRDLEGKKILKIIDEKIAESGEGAQATVSDENEQKVIAKFFEKKDIPVEIEIEPELLGGVRIVWNNVLIDNTISHQLNNLKEKIIGSK